MNQEIDTIASVDLDGWSHTEDGHGNHRFDREDFHHYVEATLLHDKYVVQLRGDFPDDPTLPGPVKIPRTGVEPGKAAAEVRDLIERSEELVE